MNLLFLDFESFYSKKEGYDLRSLPMAAYVRDSRFKAHGFAWAGESWGPHWNSLCMGEELDTVDWANTALVGHNCIPIEAEVYTRGGWKSLSSLSTGEEVMQWDSGVASFSPATAVVKKTANKMLSWNTQFHRLSYTPEHRFFYSTPSRKEFRVASAEEVSRMSPNNVYIPTAGVYAGNPTRYFSYLDGQLVEAIRADGSVDGRHIRFHLTKSRKIKRLRTLLFTAGIRYSETITKTGTTKIGLSSSEYTDKLLSVMHDKKYKANELIEYPVDFRRAILEEARFWDGHSSTKYGAYQLVTVGKESADALELIAHFTGWSVSRREISNHQWGRQQQLTIRPKNKIKLVEKAKNIEGIFPVGCITVASGAFFVRYKGHITVTGNCKFDALVLKHIYGKTAGQYIDTMAMSMAVLGKSIVGHHLKDLATFYGLEPKGVMVGEGIKELNAKDELLMAEYCIHDVELTREVFNRLKPDFPASQYKLMDWTVRTFIEPKLTLDLPLLKWAAEKERRSKAEQFAALGVDKKMLGSSKQFAAILESYGYKVPFKQSPKAKNEDGAPKLIPAFSKQDPAFLNMLASEDEKLRVLCEARLAAKSNIIETRADKLLLVGRSGKFAFDVKLSGADMTHRFSGGPGYGGNPQNLNRCQDPENHGEAPHECKGVLRKAVGVTAAEAFIVCDAANIDLRFVAYLSGDRVLVDAFEKGLDVYCGFASDFYGRVITKKNKAERFFGKTAELSLPYGSGWETFKVMVRQKTGTTISDEDAKRTVALYRAKHSGVVAFWNFLERSIPLINGSDEVSLGSTPLKIGRGAVILPSGLRIKFMNLRQRPGRFGKPEWCFDLYVDRHLVTNSLYGSFLFGLICQGLAGEHCKEVAEKFLPYLTGFVHDETQLVSKKVLAPILAKKMKIAMSTPPKWLPGMKLDADIGWGQNWLDSKN